MIYSTQANGDMKLLLILFLEKVKANGENHHIRLHYPIGLMRKIYKPNIFKPANDVQKNIWFSINLDDLKDITGKQFSEFVIFLEESNSSRERIYLFACGRWTRNGI